MHPDASTLLEDILNVAETKGIEGITPRYLRNTNRALEQGATIETALSCIEDLADLNNTPVLALLLDLPYLSSTPEIQDKMKQIAGEVAVNAAMHGHVESMNLLLDRSASPAAESRALKMIFSVVATQDKNHPLINDVRRTAKALTERGVNIEESRKAAVKSERGILRRWCTRRKIADFCRTL